MIRVCDKEIGCGCECHTSPNVYHCFPCCDFPPYRQLAEEEKKELVTSEMT